MAGLRLEHDSPRDIPLIGGSELLSVIRAKPLATLADQVARYGDILSFMAEDGPTVLLNHPAYVRHVLVSHPERYTKVGTPEMDMLRPVLGSGLMTVDGAEWRRQRDLGTRHFREEQLASYLPDMGAEISALMDRWAAVPGAIGLNDPLSGLTLSIASRCLFEAELAQSEADDVGTGVGALNEFMASGVHSDVESYYRRKAAMEKMSAIVWSVVQSGRVPLVGTRPSSLLQEILRETAAMPTTSGTDTPLQGAVDQVFTYLMAGHETTAKALTWTLHFLSSRPQLQDRLFAEIMQANAQTTPDTTGWLKRLPQTESLLYEVMRLYPPVWMISRRAVQDDEIEGWRVTKGSLVALSPYLLHRHADFWDAPEDFRPDRFLQGSGEAMSACSFLPFGAGHRNCIGRRFAMYEMILVLGKLLERFRIVSTEPQSVIPQALVTLRPETDIRIWLEPR